MRTERCVGTGDMVRTHRSDIFCPQGTIWSLRTGSRLLIQNRWECSMHHHHVSWSYIFSWETFENNVKNIPCYPSSKGEGGTAQQSVASTRKRQWKANIVEIVLLLLLLHMSQLYCLVFWTETVRFIIKGFCVQSPSLFLLLRIVYLGRGLGGFIVSLV